MRCRFPMSLGACACEVGRLSQSGWRIQNGNEFTRRNHPHSLERAENEKVIVPRDQVIDLFEYSWCEQVVVPGITNDSWQWVGRQRIDLRNHSQ